jgi:uncharacterized protein (TIGR00369 family)
MCIKHIKNVENRQGGRHGEPAAGAGTRWHSLLAVERHPHSGEGQRDARSRVGERTADADADGDTAAGHGPAADGAVPRPAEQSSPRAGGPRSLDGITSFIGMRWDDPQTVRLRIRAELMNRGGLLSGVVTYAMVDYCMGSTLWAQTTPQERIATISISINYIQTATEGEIVCRSELDRRNRTIGIMKSEIRHEDGRLLVSAVGSYSIFPDRRSGTGASSRLP